MILHINPVLHDYITQKKRVAEIRKQLDEAEEKLSEFYIEALKLPVGTSDDFAEVVREVIQTTSKGSVDIDVDLLRVRYPEELEKFLTLLRGEITDKDLPKVRLKGFLGSKKYEEVTHKTPGKVTEEVRISIIEKDPFGK
jgi:hypothetical protein